MFLQRMLIKVVIRLKVLPRGLKDNLSSIQIPTHLQQETLSKGVPSKGALIQSPVKITYFDLPGFNTDLSLAGVLWITAEPKQLNQLNPKHEIKGNELKLRDKKIDYTHIKARELCFC